MDVSCWTTLPFRICPARCPATTPACSELLLPAGQLLQRTIWTPSPRHRATPTPTPCWGASDSVDHTPGQTGPAVSGHCREPGHRAHPGAAGCRCRFLLRAAPTATTSSIRPPCRTAVMEWLITNARDLLSPFPQYAAKPRSGCRCTAPPFVRQYGILFRKWGVFVCQRDNESTTERRR